MAWDPNVIMIRTCVTLTHLVKILTQATDMPSVEVNNNSNCNSNSSNNSSSNRRGVHRDPVVALGIRRRRAGGTGRQGFLLGPFLCNIISDVLCLMVLNRQHH